MRTAVVVLGDLGRSPRMQYHALALAVNAGDVDLVGLEGAPLHTALTAEPRVRSHRLPDRAAVALEVEDGLHPGNGQILLLGGIRRFTRYDASGLLEAKRRQNPSAVRFLKAAKNLDAARIPGWLRFLGVFTRLFSKSNTQWSYEFMLTNAIKDAQTGLVNASIFDLDGFRRSMLKNLLTLKPLMASVAQSFKDVGTGTGAGGWKAEYEEKEFYEATPADTRDLYDHLRDQLMLMRLGERDLLLGEEMLARLVAGSLAHANAAIDVRVLDDEREAQQRGADAAERDRLGPGVVTLRFGAPVATQGLTYDDRDALTFVNTATLGGYPDVVRLREIPSCRSTPVIVWTVKDLSAEPGNNYFGDGIVEEAQVPGRRQAAPVGPQSSLAPKMSKPLRASSWAVSRLAGRQ